VVFITYVYVNGDSVESHCRFIKVTKPHRNLELSPLSLSLSVCVCVQITDSIYHDVTRRVNMQGLRRSNEYTLCQRAWKQKEDDQNEGCGRSDPETLVHIQSTYCVLQSREATSAHHHESLLTASSAGNHGSVTRVEGVDLPDT
jgi:hypothetical protein